MGMVRWEGGLADGLRYDYQRDPFEHWPQPRRRRGQGRTKPRRHKPGDRVSVQILTVSASGARDLRWDTYVPHHEGDVTVYRLVTPTKGLGIAGSGGLGVHEPPTIVTPDDYRTG